MIDFIYRVEVINKDTLETVYKNETEIPEVAEMMLDSGIREANKYQDNNAEIEA